MGIKKKKRIDLSQVKGISCQKQQIKSNTFYVLQFATTPKYWGEFYRKKDSKIELYSSEYEIMYITLSISNQKDIDIERLFQYLMKMDLKKTAFQPSVLGSYPGIFKKKDDDNDVSYGVNTPLKKKLKIKQWTSYFLIRLVVITAILYFIINFIGIFHGIFW